MKNSYLLINFKKSECLNNNEFHSLRSSEKLGANFSSKNKQNISQIKAIYLLAMIQKKRTPPQQQNFTLNAQEKNQGANISSKNKKFIAQIISYTLYAKPIL